MDPNAKMGEVGKKGTLPVKGFLVCLKLVRSSATSQLAASFLLFSWDSSEVRFKSDWIRMRCLGGF